MNKPTVMVIEKDQKEFLKMTELCQTLGYEVFPKEPDDVTVLLEVIQKFLSKNSPEEFLRADKVILMTFLDQYRDLCNGKPLFIVRLELSHTNPAVNGVNFFRHFLQKESVIFTSVPAVGFANLRTIVIHLAKEKKTVDFVLHGQGFEKRLRKYIHHHFEMIVA